jgi:hypothetical protein
VGHTEVWGDESENDRQRQASPFSHVLTVLITAKLNCAIYCDNFCVSTGLAVCFDAINGAIKVQSSIFSMAAVMDCQHKIFKIRSFSILLAETFNEGQRRRSQQTPLTKWTLQIKSNKQKTGYFIAQPSLIHRSFIGKAPL